MNKKPNQSKARRNIVIVSIIGIFIILVGILINNVSGSTKPIREAADTLNIPSAWQYKGERQEPPRFVCLGDNACPSLHRSWEINDSFSIDDFKTFLAANFSDYTITNNCTVSISASGSTPLCSASSKIKEFEADIVLWKNNSSVYSISISIK